MSHTEFDKAEQRRNLDLHLQLLIHAVHCPVDKLSHIGCANRNCSKMKDHLDHFQNCPASNVATENCETCEK